MKAFLVSMSSTIQLVEIKMYDCYIAIGDMSLVKTDTRHARQSGIGAL
jgi:hypothetical protein